MRACRGRKGLRPEGLSYSLSVSPAQIFERRFTRLAPTKAVQEASSGTRAVAVAPHFPAADPAKSPTVAPRVVFSGQSAVRDSQHCGAIVHVHGLRRVRQRLILVL